MSSEGVECLTESSADSASNPYRHTFEHLEDLLTRLDLLLRRELVRRGRRQSTDFLSFAAITDDEIQRLLGDRQPCGQIAPDPSNARSIDNDLECLERQIAQRVECTLAAGHRLPAAALADYFALSAVEFDVLTLCLAAELDRRYERVYGYLQDDMSRKLPSMGLALSVCLPSGQSELAVRTLLSPQAPLRHFRLVEVD